MTRDSTAAGADETHFPNRATVVGRGVPAQFEITVDGEIEAADDAFQNGTIAAGSAVEGAIDVGVSRFRFTGEMANVRLVDWNGNDASESSSTPTVHVEYGVSR